MKAMMCAAPLKVTVELDRKFAPLIVSVCAAAPAVAEAGESVVMTGTGLGFDVVVVDPDPPPPHELNGIASMELMTANCSHLNRKTK
jgi:hypothetical protein